MLSPGKSSISSNEFHVDPGSQPLKMYDKWLEAHPKDIVWANLDDGAVEKRGRLVISWLATVGLVLVWVFPVAFVGTLSNITALCAKLS